MSATDAASAARTATNTTYLVKLKARCSIIGFLRWSTIALLSRQTKLDTATVFWGPMAFAIMGGLLVATAIGINPRTVDTAVNMIGRKRAPLASTTACQTPFPSLL